MVAEQIEMAFADRHEAGFQRFRETEDGARFLDAVYKRVHVAMLEGRKVGLKRICEDVRWDSKISWNNNWSAPMGRWLLAKDARFRDVFQIRERGSVQAGLTTLVRGVHAQLGAVLREARLKDTAQKLAELQGVGWGR